MCVAVLIVPTAHSGMGGAHSCRRDDVEVDGRLSWSGEQLRSDEYPSYAYPDNHGHYGWSCRHHRNVALTHRGTLPIHVIVVPGVE